MDMDQELRKALQRVPAPTGFTERAVARVKLAGRRSWSIRNLVRIAAAIVFVTLVAVGGYEYVEREREGEQAKKQLLQAMHIAAEKADLARRAIHN